jgi:hypothetical protein
MSRVYTMVIVSDCAYFVFGWSDSRKVVTGQNATRKTNRLRLGLTLGWPDSGHTEMIFTESVPLNYVNVQARFWPENKISEKWSESPSAELKADFIDFLSGHKLPKFGFETGHDHKNQVARFFGKFLWPKIGGSIGQKWPLR